MLNKVELIGRLGHSPDVRYLPNGQATARFSLATTENWKDGNGNRQERTEWHNVMMYGKLAEIAGKYLQKGSLVHLEGKIRSRKYTGKDGVERTAYEIISDSMIMLGSKTESAPSNDKQSDKQMTAQDYARASGHAKPDDDIPF